ncbi:hypothetical protein [Kluyvera genomosp. 3]|uniref:Uncharacterized protein n=1 Tax=Kluyvera genomosp. 3 TaxID=2774055 RepID=A0A6G9RIH0_9ENTR|nr:hypothetical protein [Kluyvera genomosp. 3]EJH4367115.1 hypothetical protein [Salmonella enterica subsp. enterica serovar Bareilly]QIR26700.1 hypothetical protein GY169_07655 [Kluyvera genomosp. 3]
MEMITERRAFIPGQGPGRTPGTPNRTTRERTELFRQKLDKENLFFRAVDLAVKKLEEAENDLSKVKLDSIVNLIVKFAPYYIQNIATEEIAEQLATIASPEDAKRVAADMVAQLRVVR